MRKLILVCMTAVFFAGSCSGGSQENPDYLNSGLSVERRVADLMQRMTLEEKIGQMNQCVGLNHIDESQAGMTEEDLKRNTAQAFYPGFLKEDIAQMARDGKIGSFLHSVTIGEANELQKLAMESRLRIPLLMGIDAVHGCALVSGVTVYPTSIGMASTFDPQLVYVSSRQTAEEMRAIGMHWTFAPNVEVARDQRWGRVGETYGEDPWLVSLMGEAAVKGFQGDNGLEKELVLACAKHFVGGSQPVNGTNGAPADLSERTLREVFFPPFDACVKAGALSFMMAHNELNGVPCHSNEWLMQDVLRRQMGFNGFIVSDWMDIEHLYDLHCTAVSNEDAFGQSVNAGMDMHMHGPAFVPAMMKLVEDGAVSEARIDESCRRILEIKFRLGLFENPFFDESAVKETLLAEEHKAVALDAARKSIVLLGNNGILPLTDGARYKKIFVTGPNANSQGLMGDWTFPQPDENVITFIEGLRMIAPLTQFTYLEQGESIRYMDPAKVRKAGEMARQADLSIVFAGEYVNRKDWVNKTSGEDVERGNLNLPGLQEELIRNILASGKPCIVVLNNGHPLAVEWIAKEASALVEAWEPGMFGGQALAEVLYGVVNPSGKLPVTFPRSTGNILSVYNHMPSHYFHPVVLEDPMPLYEFGYGLSYTSYEYTNLKAGEFVNGSLEVTVDVTNTGSRAGEEIVLLYMRDDYASMTRPVKELKGFTRVALEPGETKTAAFTVREDQLAFFGKDGKWVTEPGSFTVMAGKLSASVTLKP